MRLFKKVATALAVAGLIVAATPAGAQADPSRDEIPPKPAGAIAYGVLVNGKLTAEPPIAPRLARPSPSSEVGALGSGGGCKNTLNIGSCINASGGRLRGDFYYNYDNDLTDVALVNIVRLSDGAVLGWYSTNLDHLGKYPIIEWTISGSGQARTMVDVYNNCLCDGNLQFVAQSPTYYYP